MCYVVYKRLLMLICLLLIRCGLQLLFRKINYRRMKHMFLLLFLLVVFAAGYAQQSPGNRPSDIPSSRDPEVKDSKKQPEQKKVSERKRNKAINDITRHYDLKVQEFYKRMEANAKKYRKMQREMKKPQYSDPLYFGHKKMPKKRPPGKKKYCRECGMTH
jgi:hypothetical protein